MSIGLVCASPTVPLADSPNVAVGCKLRFNQVEARGCGLSLPLTQPGTNGFACPLGLPFTYPANLPAACSLIGHSADRDAHPRETPAYLR